MDRVISWRMKRHVYAPTTASSSPWSNRCKTHCPSRNATGRRKTFPYAYSESRVRRSLLRGLSSTRVLCYKIDMEIKLTAVFRKFPEGYAAFVEELPGANTQGATLEEAR